NARIACDMHWAHTPDEAIAAIKEMEPHGLWFAEAPIATEDVQGLARVARSVNSPIGVGEEWRTVFDARLRYDAKALSIVQPEMGHKGITEFMRISQAAVEQGIEVLPHATIGTGIFLAASLQASLALKGVVGHEFQHSVISRNHGLITDGIECSNGAYRFAESTGIGVEPTDDLISRLE
ncbi:MAG: mandelate racemase/muconate lactonizing enzyme family protein, partial [Opitutales bacterium]|nr:mandelate racemase/muconate lactonizing enzyme family protein [Opitutales bacterium]